MPDSAEVDALVLELHHGRDHGRLGQPLELGGFHGLAEALGEGQLLLRRELLISKEDHEMMQESPANLGDHLIAERLRETHAADLGAEGSGHRLGFDVAIRPSGHRVSSEGYRELKCSAMRRRIASSGKGPVAAATLSATC